MATDLLVKTVIVDQRSVSVVRLEDRRSHNYNNLIDFCYQIQLESLLYNNGFGRSTGAMHKLLTRSTAGTAPNLPLKKSSIAEGLVTAAEFDWLLNHLHDSTRSFTLVPLSSLTPALGAYGNTSVAEELVAALAIARPVAWGEEEEEEEAEEEEEEEEEDGNGDKDDKSDDGEEDGEEDHGGGGASCNGGGDVSDGEASVAATEDMGSVDPPTVDDDPAIHHAKRQRRVVKYALAETPALTVQLNAMVAHRGAPILAARVGVAVATATQQEDRRSCLRFMGWLDLHGNLPSPPSLSVFTSPTIVVAIERFVKSNCSSNASGKKRTYKWAANHIGSLLATVRYVATRTKVIPSVLSQLESLHKQTLQQSRIQNRFAIGNAPNRWLEWPAVLSARVSAERAYTLYKGIDVDQRLTLIRNVLLLRLHSDQPPDR